MRFRLINISLLLLFILSINLFSGEKDVRYLSAYINNTDNTRIILTNNLVFEADYNVTTISMTPVIIILDKYKNEGYLYLKKKRTNVTLMRKATKDLYVPAVGEKLTMYNVGELTKINNIEVEKGKISLANGDVWFSKSNGEKDKLKNWSENEEVIITKNGNSTRLTNVVTADFIAIKQNANLVSEKSIE